jgi:hypothetical protein
MHVSYIVTEKAPRTSQKQAIADTNRGIRLNSCTVETTLIGSTPSLRMGYCSNLNNDNLRKSVTELD